MTAGIKRFTLLFLLLIVYSFATFAQYQGSIVDAETNEKLPFATIYIDSDHKTIANADGDFAIEASSLTGNAKVSYVGYQDLTISIAQLGSKIKLNPYAVQLNAVIAYPIDITIKKILANLHSESINHKNIESNFLYSQTTFNDKVCNEYIETYFNAKSEISLRSLSLIAGRYAALPSSEKNKYSNCTNFFSLSQMGLYTLKIAKNVPITILTTEFKKYYDIDYSLLRGKENSVYVITFTAKKHIHRSIIEGKLYVDATSLDILKFDGKMKNSIMAEKKSKIPFSLSFNIRYTQKRGFTEVESEELLGKYHYQGKQVSIKATCYNIGSKQFVGKKKIKYSNNLKEIIASQKYNPQFWANRKEIKKTSLEQEVIKLFENEERFTNIK